MAQFAYFGPKTHRQLLASALDVPRAPGYQALLDLVARGPTVVLAECLDPSELVALTQGLAGRATVVAVLRGPVDPATAVRWMRLGAASVIEPGQADPEDLQGLPVELVDRVLAWAARVGLDGALSILPGTPLEGVAHFSAGKLREAQFCWVEGRAALAAMLATDDAAIEFSRPRAPEAQRYAPSVLVVEDDEATRLMLTRQLGGLGYRVRQAANGLEALGLIEHQPFDVVMTDLDMPQLDGWGLLAALRSSIATKDLHVILLSALEDAVMTLKAARAGAHAYILKTGKAKELSDALALLTGPRRRAWEDLVEGRSCELALPAVGASWLLQTLSELEVTGRLELEDTLGRYELTVSEAHLLEATAQTGSLRADGPVALEAILCSRGRGRFVFTSDPRAEGHEPWLSEALVAAHYTLNAQAAELLRDQSPQALRINPELARLYARAATAKELALLDALRAPPESMEALAEVAGLTARDASRVVADLLHRGVLHLRKG